MCPVDRPLYIPPPLHFVEFPEFQVSEFFEFPELIPG